MWAKIKKWLEIIGGALIAIGAAVAAILWEEEKSKKPAPTPGADVAAIEAKEKADAAKLGQVDQQIPPIEAGIATTAADATAKEKANLSAPTSGDAGKAGDDLGKAW
jgi:hypothetical protein